MGGSKNKIRERRGDGRYIRGWVGERRREIEERRK